MAWLRKCGQIFRSYRILCPDLSAVVQDDEGGRDEGGKGRQKFVEDLVRHSRLPGVIETPG